MRDAWQSRSGVEKVEVATPSRACGGTWYQGMGGACEVGGKTKRRFEKRLKAVKRRWMTMATRARARAATTATTIASGRQEQ